MAEPTRACPDCGADIAHRHYKAQRCEPCSAKRNPYDAYKQRTMYDHACEHCSKPFRTRVKGQRFCSRECSGIGTMAAPVERLCTPCGATFVGRAPTCSRPCYSWAKRYPGQPFRTTCGYCSKAIVGRGRGAMYCSRNCAAMTMIGRRRANRLGKPVHRIRPRDIFKRDDWTCHLCAEPIDPKQRGWHPGTASLDHLIPVAHPQYPGHIAANLAAAHRGCNSAKRERARPEDFALYQRLLATLGAEGVEVQARPWMRPGTRTHCTAGHEYTEENTYQRPDGGGRQCKQCSRRRQQEKLRREDPQVKAARFAALRRNYPKRAA